MKRVIGITGGIASGKSNVSNVIKSLGYHVIDSDLITHKLEDIGGKVYNAIVLAFGKSYLKDDKSLDRKKLGNLIFSDSKAKEKLNSISHPIIVDEIKKEINNINDEMIFVDIPLLYESRLEYLCDKIICVYLPKNEQIKRLIFRDNIDEEFAIKKVDSQMSLDKKKELADYVIDSRGTFLETKKQVEDLIKELKEN